MRTNIFKDSKRNQKCNYGGASNAAQVIRRVHGTYMYIYTQINICAQIKTRASTIV